jgi:hypothetical protein
VKIVSFTAAQGANRQLRQMAQLRKESVVTAKIVRFRRRKVGQSGGQN